MLNLITRTNSTKRHLRSSCLTINQEEKHRNYDTNALLSCFRSTVGCTCVFPALVIPEKNISTTSGKFAPACGPYLPSRKPPSWCDSAMFPAYLPRYLLRCYVWNSVAAEVLGCLSGGCHPHYGFFLSHSSC